MPAQHRVYAGFFMFAVAMGSLLSRLADLQLQFGVTEGVLGLTIIGMSIGSLIAITFAGPLISRAGQKRTIFFSLSLMVVALGLVPAMPDVRFAFFCLFAAGLGIGALEIAFNVETDRIEAQIGRRIMARAHGFWSVGFFVAALASMPVRQAGVSSLMHMAVAVPLLLVAMVLVFARFEPAPPRGTGSLEKPPPFARPTPAILALCMVAVSPMLMEGAGLDWSVIYMRDTFAVEPAMSGASLTLFTLAMALGRLFGDRFVEHFGPREVTYALLAVSALGTALVGFAPAPWVALLGFALMGGGASAVYPIAVSEAARRTDRSSQTNVASLAQIAFLVFLLAPPLLGLVAEHFGIRTTYLVCLPLVAVSMAFASRVSKRPVKAVEG